MRQRGRIIKGFLLSIRESALAYIEGARDRPQEFKKRLNHFVEMTKKNKQFGFGGIEKHY